MAKDDAAEKRRVQVLSEFENSDLKDIRNEYHFRTPFLIDALEPLLKDKRDIPMLCLLINIFEVVVPGAITVYAINLWQPPMSLLTCNLVGIGYIAMVLLLFQERFTLFLHFASHRSMFHNEILNSMINYVVAPFFGIPSGIYKFHHVVMHHVENNHELDASSTEDFQRDSWSDFAFYWFRFVCLIWFELFWYSIRTKKWGWFVSAGSGLASWLTVIAMLMKYVSPLATCWVFIVPHILAMSLMSFGNWAQHMFVNPADRFSNYALTYNCIDTPGNRTTFNDGYHVIHHLNARMHWSEIPQHFHDNLDKFAKNGALTFRNIHFFDVGILVMTKQLRKLAEDHYVHLGDKETAPTVDEIEAKLKSWLVPLSKTAATTNGKKAQ